MNRKFGLLLLVACIFSGGLFAGIARYDITNHLIGYDPALYGPYVCISSCNIGTPAPDPSTFAYITSIDNAYARDNPEYAKTVGDKFIICNMSYCATYTRTSSITQFLGSNVVPQQNAGGGGGGGGTGTGGTTYGIVSYTPVYRTVTTCTPSGCANEQILIGYEPVYGWLTTRGGTTRER